MKDRRGGGTSTPHDEVRERWLASSRVNLVLEIGIQVSAAALGHFNHQLGEGLAIRPETACGTYRVDLYGRNTITGAAD